jgi:hypothetical protein
MAAARPRREEYKNSRKTEVRKVRKEILFHAKDASSSNFTGLALFGLINILSHTGFIY